MAVINPVVAYLLTWNESSEIAIYCNDIEEENTQFFLFRDEAAAS